MLVLPGGKRSGVKKGFMGRQILPAPQSEARQQPLKQYSGIELRVGGSVQKALAQEVEHAEG